MSFKEYLEESKLRVRVIKLTSARKKLAKDLVKAMGAERAAHYSDRGAPPLEYDEEKYGKIYDKFVKLRDKFIKEFDVQGEKKYSSKYKDSQQKAEEYAHAITNNPSWKEVKITDYK